MPVHAGASAALHRQTSLAHSDSSWGADRPGDKPVAANSVSLGPPRSQRVGASWASEVFYEHLLERRRIQHRLRQQLLQLAVLVLQRLELAGNGGDVDEYVLAVAGRPMLLLNTEPFRRACRHVSSSNRRDIATQARPETNT